MFTAQRQFKFLLLGFFFLLPAARLWAQEFDFSKYVRLADAGQVQTAITELSKIQDDQMAYEQLHQKYFILGKWTFELNKWSESRTLLQNAIKYGRVHAAQIFYLIGHSHKEENQWDPAIENLERALDYQPSQKTAFLARLELSEIHMQKNELRKAREHLKSLEKRWRGTPNYTLILWRAMDVEFRDNVRHRACLIARKLFTKFPADPILAHWGADLAANKIEKQSIGCLSSEKDVTTRLKNLVFSGQADRARREIDQLRERMAKGEAYKSDQLLIGHLERVGFPDEALTMLLRYYDDKKTDYNYQNQLARISSRAGEFPTAIGAYDRAYKLNPGSRYGREALFSAGFLSYQIQDYDGAYRRFGDLVRKFAGSSLARDAKWYMAWLQYLREDYSGAEKSFRSLLAERHRVGRRRRVVHPYLNERTKYWLAMSMFRQGGAKQLLSRPLFSTLANDKSIGYYSLLAKNRLAQMPPELLQRQLAALPAVLKSEMAEVGAIAEATDKTTDETTAEVADEVTDAKVSTEQPSTEVAGPTLVAGESETEGDGESEETDTESLPDGAGESDVDGVALDIQKDETMPQMAVEEDRIESFRQPALQERFHRARQLMALGQNELAKWELYEIEKHTRNKTYLKMLMNAYIKIQAYNRATYISETYFAGERAKQGMTVGRELWQMGFPAAYSQYVREYSSKFGVPDSFVLAIMRAESHFNKEAYSPVGARGLMQIMPFTANQLSRLLGESEVPAQDLLKPEVNIRLGSKYLSRLQSKFQNQLPLVAAGYNAGPHRVNSWLNNFGTLESDEFIEHVPFQETRNYMKKVVRNYAVYNELYGGKRDTYVWLTQPIPVRVSHRPSPRENWDALD